MTVTFATPLIQTARQNSKSISNIFTNLFKNKGVQVGVGLTATGGGILALNESAKQVTNPLGIEGSSTILVIAIIFIVLVLFMRRK